MNAAEILEKWWHTAHARGKNTHHRHFWNAMDALNGMQVPKHLVRDALAFIETEVLDSPDTRTVLEALREYLEKNS